jgi:hypothetical protein
VEELEDEQEPDARLGEDLKPDVVADAVWGEWADGKNQKDDFGHGYFAGLAMVVHPAWAG